MQKIFEKCVWALRGLRAGGADSVAGEEVEHLLLGRRVQHICCGEFLGLNVICGADARGGRVQIVIRVAKLDSAIVAEHEPVRAGASERHADAAGVDDARFADGAVELHVGVATDDEGRVRIRKNRRERLFGREAGENFVLVARRGVAEKRFAERGDAEAKSFWPGREQISFGGGKFARGPLQNGAHVFWNRGAVAGGFFEDGEFAIAANEINGNIEALEARDYFARHGAGDDVTTDDDAIGFYGGEFAQDGFERGKVAVNVVKSSDAHGRLLWHIRRRESADEEGDGESDAEEQSEDAADARG